MKQTSSAASCAIAILFGAAACAAAPYFTTEEMPDLVKCLPAPPDAGSAAFAYDVVRYNWGKAQRNDSAQAAEAVRDAEWSLKALFSAFDESFGLALTKETTPEIWKLLEDSIATTDQMRVKPKAYFHRKRPFTLFNEPPLSPKDDAEWGNEGSYPSGHTVRSWCTALILAEVNPGRANEIFARGWRYGVNRVIAGAHWQSDVDASRVAAAIGYSRLQTSPAFRAQMARAKAEFASARRPTLP